MQDLKNWETKEPPALREAHGHYVRLTLFDPEKEAEQLFGAISQPEHDVLWTFIPMGPFVDATTLGKAFAEMARSSGWITYLIHSRGDDRVTGTLSYMRVRPFAGSAEIGCVIYSPELKQTPVASEVQYLMARHIFDDLGYRRYEWKCDNNNLASKRAAVRLGFQFEGVFRQDLVVKGRNRDTAWFSITDKEWPSVRDALELWLKPENFDGNGRQVRRLQELRERP